MRPTVLEEFFKVFLGVRARIKVQVSGGSPSYKQLIQLRRIYYKNKTKEKPTKKITQNGEECLPAFSANNLERLLPDLKTVYDESDWSRAFAQNFKSTNQHYYYF